MKKYIFLTMLILFVKTAKAMEEEDSWNDAKLSIDVAEKFVEFGENENKELKRIKNIYLKPFDGWKFTWVSRELIEHLEDLHTFCGPCAKELERIYQANNKGSILSFPFETGLKESLEVLLKLSAQIRIITYPPESTFKFWGALFKHGFKTDALLVRDKSLKEHTLKALELMENCDSLQWKEATTLLKLIKEYEKKQK